MATKGVQRRSFKDKAKERLGETLNKVKNKSLEVKAQAVHLFHEEHEPSIHGETGPTATVHGIMNPFESAETQVEPGETSEPPKPVFTNVGVESEPPKPVFTNMGSKEGDEVSSKKHQKKKEIASKPAQPLGSIEYIVKDRDTLTGIAAHFDTTPSELVKMNKMGMRRMVFPGEAIFVPDKDYDWSTVSPTLSPAEVSDAEDSDDKPTQVTDKLAEAIKSSAKPQSTDASGESAVKEDGKNVHASQKVKPPTARKASDTQQLDQDCHARFIKVNVKHITFGQGVVNGVLLVTPNAVMFDPDVMDHLVLEHGAEKYGMIAPMETIISAAIYHDIAAMTLSMSRDSGSASPDSPKPEIYSASCPIHSPSKEKYSAADHTDESKERSCSCGEESEGDRITKPTEPTSAEDVPKSDQEDFQKSTPTSQTDTGSSAEDVDKIENVEVKSQHEGNNKKEKQSSLSSEKEGEDPDKNATGEGSDGEIEKDETTEEGAASPPPLTPHMTIGNIEYFQYGKVNEKSSQQQQGCTHVHLDAVGNNDVTTSQDEITMITEPAAGPDVSPVAHQIPGIFSQTKDFITSLVSASLGSDSAPESPKRQEIQPNQIKEKSAADIRGAIPDNSSSSEKPNTAKPENPQDDVVEVENLVKPGDMPELWQSIEELVPRPAAFYEDPPLYLCLRVGKPINKSVSKTCPIESYVKKKRKPEYWFSVPRDKVAGLYGFFIHWSPDIYGSDADIDPKERGFMVIDNDDDELEVIDDYYGDSNQYKITKDWEIVNKEEVKRRLSQAEEEAYGFPEMSDPSTILSEQQVRKLMRSLPPRAVGYPWVLRYSSDKHGFSLKTVYRSSTNIDSPTLIVLKDTHDKVFGALTSCALKMSDTFYGTGESFLYTFHPEFKKFGWTGNNSFFIKGNMESLAIGAGEGSFGIWLDGDIYHGRTQHCQTYDNDILTDEEDFMVKGMEIWMFE